MNNEEKKLLKHIKLLHKAMLSDYKESLQRAMQIGEALEAQKDRVGHGHFIKFVTDYLPFSERTSRNYLALHKNKERINKANITSIREAYLLIHNFNVWVRDKHRTLTKDYRKDFPNQEVKYNNPRTYINKTLCGDNITVMDKMLSKKMGGAYTAVITSPPYSANMNYGKGYDDNKPYEEYMDELLKPFKLYAKLLRKGGRVIYVIGSMVKNPNKDTAGDYNHTLVADLITKVREQFPEFRLFDNIIWNKGSRGRNPLNTKWGTYNNPAMPICRSMHEHVLIWSKEQFNLENITGKETDLTEEEFKDLSWSVWDVSPYSHPKNPHPCSYPSKLIERLIKYYTFPDDLILDPYAGVSVTALMCKKHKRRYTMIELNSNYCKWANEKLKKA